ncbi:hypothetical protein [Chitinophaga filiformis]|uniref:Uncharacterized protein n=1 Tax=Chitinophaga filiformis TaxID=104663 RepID=A0A1G7QT17_CHIFI|nr:hypothetical protein [Chitinophaga filiformis]SDG01662.1 hypothetical protein SAMN04488121_103183 [Chitinophaga filiformis]
MDLIFEMLIPSGIDVPGITFREPFYEWQGERYPQGPPETSFGSNFKLVYGQIPDFVKNKIPVAYASVDWQCICVKGSGLDLYGHKLWMDLPEDEEPEDPEEEHFTLRDLLHTICTRRKWIIVIDIDEAFEVMPSGGLSDVITALNGVIIGEIEGKGFLICGEGSELCLTISENP